MKVEGVNSVDHTPFNVECFSRKRGSRDATSPLNVRHNLGNPQSARQNIEKQKNIQHKIRKKVKDM
jgi:hypothetical protein